MRAAAIATRALLGGCYSTSAVSGSYGCDPPESGSCPANRVWLAAALALLLGACYAPAAPSGAYLCDESGCPSNLQCVCGVCVAGADDAACSIGVAFSAPACSLPVAAGCVREGDEFDVTLTAFKDSAYSKPSTYSGTAVLGSSWGHARAGRFQFKNGVATVKVTLDRATPANSSAVITARAGTTRGVSVATIAVDPQPLVAEPAPILKPGDGWAKLFVGLPSLDATSKRLYYNGVASFGDLTPRIGVASSSDGKTWTPASQPLFDQQGPKEIYLGPSVVRTSSPKEVQLYFSTAVAGSSAGANLSRARSSDDGVSFGAPAVVVASADCAVCSDGKGLLLPWAIQSPVQGLLLFFTHGGQSGSNVAIGRSTSNGDSWLLSPVPEPGSGQGGGFTFETAYAARVIYDAATQIYRMWYTAQIDLLNLCKNEIRYATSEDGLFWTGARDNGRALSVADVPWVDAQTTGLVAGAIEIDDSAPGAATHYRVWFSPMQLNLLAGTCLPTGIGRASRK